MSTRADASFPSLFLFLALASCGRVLDEQGGASDATAPQGDHARDSSSDGTANAKRRDGADGHERAEDGAIRIVDGGAVGPTWPDGDLPLDTDGGCPCGLLGCDCCENTSCSGTVTCVDHNGCIASESIILAREPEGWISVVAADDASVYWCADNGVKRIAKAGGAVATLAPETHAEGALSCAGLVVDEANVYWARVTGNTGSIQSVAKQGGIVSTLATGFAPPTSLYLAHGRLYWTTNVSWWATLQSGTVLSVPTSGENAPLAFPDLVGVGCIATQDDTLYWYEEVAGQPGLLGMSPLGGGSATTLLTLPNSGGCNGLAPYGSELFASLDIGTVGVYATTRANALLDSSSGDGVMAADGSGVYELSTGGLAVWRPGYGAITFMNPGQGNLELAVGIALDEQFVYWATNGGELTKTSKW